MAWPNNAPKDLADSLDELARYRNAPAMSNVWAVLKEWLERQDVKPPSSR
jgi:hypothetical protein